MRRSAHWKYVFYTGGGEELYDPAADPRELCNLAVEPEFGEVAAAERERLLAHLKEQGTPVPA